MSNDIDKLIAGRIAIDEYIEACRIKGCKSPADSNRMISTLADIGFDTASFYDFNFDQNLKEVDRSYRFRRWDNPEAPALCDSCVGRFTLPCYSNIGDCSVSGIDMVYAFDKHTPDDLWKKEQEEESARTGAIPAFFAKPFCFFMMQQIVYPPEQYCTGVAVKILEPRFDVLWGMENYKIYEIGNTIFLRAMENKV